MNMHRGMIMIINDDSNSDSNCDNSDNIMMMIDIPNDV